MRCNHQSSSRVVSNCTFVWCLQHRQMLYSARDSFQTQLVNEICGVTPPTTPRDKPLYIHSTTKRQRRRHRQRARRFAEEEFGWQRDHRPTIVAYGDAVLSHMSGFAPLPHWGFSEKLACSSAHHSILTIVCVAVGQTMLLYDPKVESLYESINDKVSCIQKSCFMYTSDVRG
ncbi:hypothetical protein BJV82DRAFT_164491 [Fennellomyces sp. T-0311]|nr:hypothetical protein BJV82DRAFT_164491 [Fennellomyces sp. T-0311]